MFGDVFGTRTDYSKGILYASRNMYLHDEDMDDLGEGWQDGDKIRAPSNMMSKQQLKRDRLRRKFLENGVIEIKHIKALEDIQAHSDRSARIREAMKLKSEIPTRLRQPKKFRPINNGATTETTSSAPSPNKLSTGLSQRETESKAKTDSLSSNNSDSKSRSDSVNEHEKKVAAAWQYVTEEGHHPYWYNELNGKMQFENPFKSQDQILQELEEEESKGQEFVDNFAFLDDWKYASKYSEEIIKPEKKRKMRTKNQASSIEEEKV